MSEILQLAKTFEENLNEQAKSTKQMLSRELLQHERSLREALKSSEETLIGDIQESQKRLRATALSSWKWIVITLGLLGLIVAMVLGTTGWMISDNLMKIREQRAALAQMETHGLRLVTQTENGKKAVYLILPRGQKLGAPFIHEKQQTVKIEKK